MQVKKCTKCFRVKQLSNFAKNARNKTNGCQPKCKECNKAYYLANQERVKARVAKDYFDNHESKLERRRELSLRPDAKKKKAAQDKAYYLNNKEGISEYHKEWSKANRQRLRDYWHEWYHKNLTHTRMYYRVLTQKRRAAIRKNGNNTLTLEQVMKLFDNHPYCEYCNKVDCKLTIDHVIPISKGGQNYLGNVTIACETCNFSKGNKLLEVWLQPRYT